MHLHLGVFLSHCAISYNLSTWGSSAVGNKGKCWKICGSRPWKEIDRTSPLDQGSHRLCCICQQRQWSLAWQLLPGLLPSLGVVQILQLYSINAYASICKQGTANINHGNTIFFLSIGWSYLCFLLVGQMWEIWDDTKPSYWSKCQMYSHVMKWVSEIRSTIYRQMIPNGYFNIFRKMDENCDN